MNVAAGEPARHPMGVALVRRMGGYETVSLDFLGDIDGDVRPDLIRMSSDHDNLLYQQLWLSRGASRGESLGLEGIALPKGC